ncbi:MAG: hypothetical protein E7385_08755 [Ruminococcaceae bacterium]|nr:hypothetical protein [Oscillospiraceae bacterium]
MKNNVKKEAVQKREYIDCAVFDEVEKKYPKISKKGVAYDLGLTYVTFEKGYLETTMLRKLIKEHGAEIMAVIMFFRMEMCQPHGWYCCVDDDSLEVIIERCAFALKMEEDTVSKYYDALIEKRIFYVIENEKGKYLADTQQLFNFEMLHATRAYDRVRKNIANDEHNADEIVTETNTPPIVPLKGVAPDEPICDLPNDESDPFDW